ncbi:hypothetical protein AZ34_09900 [Hylemonella gracilis str. Niagara R]|uniref:DUF2946 domain-containing protein n=1 Tax=Hylemonella gracilis str. Niagara R TaxID=1458275 RepID=A0A016XJG3_9BURK|nr:hypothetical protein [Hylemonella gracilis]EYC51363.1 hypothetical protein AZ34_09900 [Hylemonella gracilis str. Niagara R]
MKTPALGHRPLTLARAVARGRLGLVLLAWFAQLCLPLLAHATMMAAPQNPSSWWCGDRDGAAEMWATLPAEIRAGLDAPAGTDGDGVAHVSVCSQLCALGTALALPAQATLTQAPVAVAQLRLPVWSDPVLMHRHALAPPAQGPPTLRA